MNQNKFKVNLIAILIGTNIGIFFFGVDLGAATFSMLTLSIIAYVLQPPEKNNKKEEDEKEEG